jgi:flagellum-specific peptidoglycan hydrolase FlgJ
VALESDWGQAKLESEEQDDVKKIRAWRTKNRTVPFTTEDKNRIKELLDLVKERYAKMAGVGGSTYAR